LRSVRAAGREQENQPGDMEGAKSSHHQIRASWQPNAQAQLRANQIKAHA
jgi:phosphate-selective porin